MKTSSPAAAATSMASRMCFSSKSSPRKIHTDQSSLHRYCATMGKFGLDRGRYASADVLVHGLDGGVKVARGQPQVDGGSSDGLAAADGMSAGEEHHQKQGRHGKYLHKHGRLLVRGDRRITSGFAWHALSLIPDITSEIDHLGVERLDGISISGQPPVLLDPRGHRAWPGRSGQPGPKRRAKTTASCPDSSRFRKSFRPCRRPRA